MEVHEILDRYEMLYSDKIPVLSDLRRTIIDEDLSSIFRIATSVSMDKDEVDDLRKQLKILKELNIRLIDEKPRLGVGGCEIAFVHPDSTGGVLVELSQPLPEKSL